MPHNHNHGPIMDLHGSVMESEGSISLSWKFIMDGARPSQFFIGVGKTRAGEDDRLAQ